MLARLVAPLSAVVVLALAGFSPARAGLTLASQFNAGVGQLVGCAYDPFNGTVWVYDSFGSDLRQYTLAGGFVSSVPRPGESANDFDLEVAPVALTLGGTPVPAGTLLVINGETGVADIYAVDKTTGAVLASLTTSFGVSHVVGGGYHAGRGTFFLVQDRVPSGAANQSLVAEVNAQTGAVLGTFKVDVSLPGFTVNFGDLDVSAASGNVWVVSDDEGVIAEFTPGGTFVQQFTLPGPAGGLSGVGLDDAGGGAWVSSTGGLVTHLTGMTWSHLGNALAGTAGLPALAGSGSLVSGSPTSLSVTHARPLSTAYLFVGLAAVGLPFKGGTLVPQPDVLSPALPVNGAGETALAFPWPAGLPAGFPLWYQTWIVDPLAVKGFAASNALKSVTP